MFRRLSQHRTPPGPAPFTGGASATTAVDRWRAARGAVRVEVDADVIGGFPGFAEFAGLIVDATVVLTDRYLLVDEGEPHGFGLPLAQVDRARVDDVEVWVGYRQEGERRSFLLRVRRSRRSPRPRSAAEGLLGALRGAGVHGEIPPPDEGSTVSLSWDDASAIEHERVRWTGRVTAPVAVGRECAPSDVWVSAESLLWTSPRAAGVNRVALGEILSVVRTEIDDAAGSPVAYVAIGDGAAGLVDLPFIFNLGDSPDANDGARAEFLTRIQAERLPHAAAPTRLQPWALEEAGPGVGGPDHDARVGRTDEPPHTADDGLMDDVDQAVDGDLAVAPDVVPSPGDGTEVDGGSEVDDAPAFTGWPEAHPTRRPLSSGGRREHGAGVGGGIAARRWRHTRGVDGAVVPEVIEELAVEAPHLPDLMPEPEDIVLAEWAGAEPAKAYAAWPGVDVAVDEQPAEPPPPPVPTAVPAYEKAAMATIDAVLFVVSRRLEGNSAPPLTTVPPSSVEQAAALSELVELTAAGVMTPEEAREAKARLVAVGEASVRLRTLLELSNAGHLSLTELVRKRDGILRGIGHPVPGEGEGEEG